MMKTTIFTLMIALIFAGTTTAQQFEVNDQWLSKIKKLAPEKPEVEAKKKYKVLVFDLITGFDHWVTPHTSQIVKIIGEKSEVYEVEISQDIFKFEKKNLKKYDAVVLNNTCSKKPDRNLFLDKLNEDESLSDAERKAKAAQLEANLISYVKKGNGLMVVHGGIVMQNNSMAFSEMLGGSFDYHPKQQELELKLVDAKHPMLKAFDGESFVHVDEPYLFNNAYKDKNFRPLLYMEASKLQTKKPLDENIRYVSWIKKHGKGRVFYVSPAHNAQSFDNPKLLKYFLDGMQYVLGDLKCDDSPIGN